MNTSRLINWPFVIPLLIFTLSVAALATAYTAQYVFGLEPCILCLWQRVPFMVAGVLGIMGMRARPGPGLALIVALAGAVFLSGAGLAAYHVGVERHWWVSGCTGQLALNINIQDFRAQLLKKLPKPCDQDIWTVFGISMAAYNVAFSLALAIGSFAAAGKILKRN
jgi:disulfide bond formation protein DsbB